MTRSSAGRVLKELQKNSNLLLTLLERADNTEKRLRVVEEQISKASTSISSSDATPSRSQRKGRAKTDVPSGVRVSSDMSCFVHHTCIV